MKDRHADFRHVRMFSGMLTREPEFVKAGK
jgi:hypothetical protein